MGTLEGQATGGEETQAGVGDWDTGEVKSESSFSTLLSWGKQTDVAHTYVLNSSGLPAGDPELVK